MTQLQKRLADYLSPLPDEEQLPIDFTTRRVIIGPTAAKAAIAVIVVAIIAISLGLFLTPRPKVAAPEVAAAESVAENAGAAPGSISTVATAAETQVPTANPETIVISVVGLVYQPGVVHVPGTARVVDAVNAAGGLLPEANPASINLAAPLSDGQQIVVSDVAAPQPPPAAETPPGGSADTPSTSDSSSAEININTASAKELEELPGIGPATAAKIVSYREENGPFASVEALEEVSGIGPAKVDGLRDVATVG